MAPERFDGLPGDERSDFYSLALVIFELVAGHYPYEKSISPNTSDTDRATFSLVHQHSQPDWDRLSHFVQLQPLLERMLEKQPEKRPVSLKFMLDELEVIKIAISKSSRNVRPELRHFEEGAYVWHPKLHEILGYKKYIYAMKSAHHAEDIRKLYSAIRLETSLSCTLMRVLGKNDIIASVWEGRREEARAVMQRLDKDNRAETLEVYEVDLILINRVSQRKKHEWINDTDKQVIDRLLKMKNDGSFTQPNLYECGYILDTIYSEKQKDEIKIIMNIECNTKRLEDAEMRHICTDIYEYLQEVQTDHSTVLKQAIFGCVDRKNIFVECIIRGYYSMSKIIYGMIDYIENNRPARNIHYVYNSHLESDRQSVCISEDGYIISTLDREMQLRGR